MNNREIEDYNRFLDEAVDFNSDDSNFKFTFPQMTKKYGRAFISYCIAAWEANGGGQTAEEFCKMNANMPIKFFESKINNYR